MRKRTRAREIALRLLYQAEFRDERPTAKEIALEVAEMTADPEVARFAEELIEGTLSRLSEIDRAIAEVVEHWAPERIAFVDRSVLRLATYELLYREDIPAKVSINEAIELAKRYSTEQSGAFVNGLLDRIRKKTEERTGWP